MGRKKRRTKKERIFFLPWHRRNSEGVLNCRVLVGDRGKRMGEVLGEIVGSSGRIGSAILRFATMEKVCA